MQEIWKDVTGYEGLYKVSNLGHITSKSFNFSRLMKTKPSKDGYVRVLLFKSGKYKAEYMHILVARAFLKPKRNQTEVNHINGNKANNAVTNLEWCTRSENTKHALRLGLKKNPMKNKFGSDNHKSKPVYQYDMQGNLVKIWASQSDAARFYNGLSGSITNCVKHRKKSYKGFRWERKPL